MRVVPWLVFTEGLPAAARTSRARGLHNSDDENGEFMATLSPRSMWIVLSMKNKSLGKFCTRPQSPRISHLHLFYDYYHFFCFRVILSCLQDPMYIPYWLDWDCITYIQKSIFNISITSKTFLHLRSTCLRRILFYVHSRFVVYEKHNLYEMISRPKLCL